jgi:hypothetical protein
MGWRVLRDGSGNERISEVLAVHAALLHTGRILYFGGDEHDPGRNVRGRTDSSVLHTARLFDCRTNQISSVDQLDTDVFCCGHAFLADGQLLVAGGTGSYDQTEEEIAKGKEAPENPHHHFTGLPNTFIFNPDRQKWTEVANMVPRPDQDSGGRWYPTLVTLPDGNVLAMSGHPHESDRYLSALHANNIPEIYYPPYLDKPQGWKRVYPLGDAGQSYYPRLHVLSTHGTSSVIFTSSPLNANDRWCYMFNPYDTRDYERICDLSGIDEIYFGYYGTSVLLPLLPEQRYWPQVLLFGGEQPIIIDPYSRQWSYTPARQLQPPRKRFHANSIILPTGEVFICGGVEVSSDSENFQTEGMRAVMEGEIYNSRSRLNPWATTSRASVIRNYHSVALLMPDGRVWTAGSNINGNYSYRSAAQFLNDATYRDNVLLHDGDDRGVDNRERKIEIFEPDYIFANRPIINSSPSTIGTVDPFEINVTQADFITRVAILRTGTATHAFNSDQRYIGLTIAHRSGDRIRVNPPPTHLTIPGYYLLFAIKGNTEVVNGSIPSEGKFIKIVTNQIPIISEELELVKPGQKGFDPPIKEIFKKQKETE